MKLEFVEWKIRLVSSNAMQYDNKAWKLELVGDLPDGWRWEAMIANGENMDIIPLEADGTGASALLTAENLSLWGDYAVQIRGKNGDVVRHSNKIHVYIPNSLSGDAKWPALPTEFSQAEKRITEAAEHPPVPGDNGCWMIWDVSAGAYRQSDVPVTVAPVDRTSDMTQPVGRDQDGKLWTAPGGGGGKSAYQYAQEGGYTGTEAEFAAKLAEELPDKLPNPNALTFTGAVTGSYDGSAPLSVEIPSGGGGGGSSSMQETVLASGVVASGTAKWHNEDTGLTVADLQEWKVWGFVSASNTQSVSRGIGFGSIKTIYFGGAEKCSAVCSWFDDERKAIQVIKAISGDGYIGVNNNFFNNSNRIFSASNLVAQGSAIPYVTNETDKVYFYTNEALTEDASFKIVGLIK